MKTIACIIPTFNGESYIVELLQSIHLQDTKTDIYIVDSSSADMTVDLARPLVKNIKIIPSYEFNHGGTRQLMIDSIPHYDIYVLLTQDTILCKDNSISELVHYFNDSLVGAVCGRQLPHSDANVFSAHARFFNYSELSQIKSASDIKNLGLKTAFMSNSFSAYRAEAIKDVGGFPSGIIFGEDMYIAAKMLLNGWKIAYSSNATCFHSHNYSLMQEFSRYFDMGVFHSRESWIRLRFGGASGEGLKYVKSEIHFLGLQHMYLWPLALIRNFVKLMGYKLGTQESLLPIWVKKRIGMNSNYWT